MAQFHFHNDGWEAAAGRHIRHCHHWPTTTTMTTTVAAGEETTTESPHSPSLEMSHGAHHTSGDRSSKILRRDPSSSRPPPPPSSWRNRVPIATPPWRSIRRNPRDIRVRLSRRSDTARARVVGVRGREDSRTAFRPKLTAHRRPRSLCRYNRIREANTR